MSVTAETPDLICIGQITGAQGLKGEVRIYSYAESKERFASVEKLYIGGRAKGAVGRDSRGKDFEKPGPEAAGFDVRKITSVRYKGAMPILTLEGVTDRTAAEALQFRYVYMDADELPEPGEGEYYVRDMVGLPVAEEDGTVLGTLKDVETDTPQKLYVVERADGRGELLIPGVDEFILEKDPAGGRILVRLPKGLKLL